MGLTVEHPAGAGFRPGDRVRVKEDRPAGHQRTPWYVKGRTGRVAAYCGDFPNPESSAHGGTGLPHQPLYRVEFDQTHVWGDRYEGPSGDKVLVDIYGRWLELA